MVHNLLKKFTYTALAVFVTVALGNAALAGSPAGKAQSITLMQGKSQLVAVGPEATEIIVSDPDIVEVGPIKDDQLYMIGSALGDTNVLVMDDKGTLLRELSVHVHVDTSRISDAVKTLYPHEDVSISAIGDQFIITGSVTNAEVAARIRDEVQRFATAGETVVNNLSIEGNQQVMIQVRVVEISRNILNELGIETDASGLTKGNFSATHSTADSMGLSIDPSFGTGSLIFSSTGTGPIQMMMRALERDGLVNTLAQPNLTAISGENARFLAGGEFPAPSGLDANGNVTYEYKPFGVSLSFKPVVLDKKRINLQISTEVSEVSTELTLELAGVTVPSFATRRAETTVEIASGGSLMIAGIIQSKAIERMNKLPGIANVPVLGALARSESFTRNETELLIMITPYLVEPFAYNQADIVVDETKRTEPLNRALAESLAIAYGEHVHTYADGRPFGYIME